MSITTEQFVSDFVDQLVAQGVDLSDAAALKTGLKAKYDAWLDSTDALPANVGQKLASAAGWFQSEVLKRYDFWTIPANGGPHGDGTFDLTLPDGTVVPVQGLAALRAGTVKGASLLTGSGAPDAGLGAVGDVYINRDTWDLYGPKSVSGWGAPVVGTQLQAWATQAANGATAAAGSAASVAATLASLSLLSDDYDDFIKAETDPTGKFLTGINTAGEFLAKLGIDIGVANGLTLTWNETTRRMTLGLGAAEGQMNIGTAYTYVADDYEDVASAIVAPDGGILEVSRASGASIPDEVIIARGSRTSLDGRLSNSLTADGYLSLPYYGDHTLRDWSFKKAGIQDGQTVTASIAFFGDSWTQRQGYVELVSRRLRQFLGDGGIGWCSLCRRGGQPIPSPDPATTSVSHTGTWSEVSAFDGRGPDLLESTSSNIGDKATLATTLTNIISAKLYFVKQPGGGDLQYRVNGGSWTTVSTANVSAALGSVTLAGIPSSAFTLDVQVATAAPVTLLGVDLRAAKGAIVHRFGHSSSRAAHWAAAPSMWDQVVAAIGVDASVVMLGTNDQGNNDAPGSFGACLATIVGRLRAIRAGCDVALACPAENLGGRAIPMSAYRDAMFSIATSQRAAFVDFVKIFGEATSGYDGSSYRAFITAADNIHPQASGYQMLASGFRRLFIERT